MSLIYYNIYQYKTFPEIQQMVKILYATWCAYALGQLHIHAATYKNKYQSHNIFVLLGFNVRTVKGKFKLLRLISYNYYKWSIAVVKLVKRPLSANTIPEARVNF